MEIDRLLRKELIALLRGENAHMDFEDVIADFPAEGIGAKAPNTPYSIWHILEHMRIAQWDILEFIRNPDHVSPVYPEGYRPAAGEKPGKKEWETSVDGFRADLKAFEEMVGNPKTDLFAPIPHAPEYTIFREVLLAADHNAYHLGEIAILRQVLDLWPPHSEYLTLPLRP